MSKTTLPKWTEDRASELTNIVGAESPVSVATVARAAEVLETTTRSVASKLRKMGFEVESAQAAKTKSYTDEEEAELSNFVTSNSGAYTYEEIAANVLGGSRTAKQIQGKLLSMELTSHVKPAPVKETVKKYTDEEEAKLVGLVKAGGFIEDIAEAMGRPVNSVRGKILSMSRKDESITIPKQRDTKPTAKVDVLEGVDVANLTVAEIAEQTGKTERGVKVMLTHRGLSASDYDGAAKRAKADSKKED